MVNQHLIALDLDGTLLKDDKTISTFTKEMIYKAKEAGHIVVIATGRPFRSSSMYYDELDLNTPIVNFNGAFVHHPKDEKWGIYHSPLELSTAKNIVEACERFHVKNVLAEVMDDVFFHYHDEKLLDIFKFGNPTVKTGDLRNILKQNPTSILIHSTEEKVPEIQSYLSDVHADLIEHRSWAVPWNVIEIVKFGINKAVGLRQLSDYFKIPSEHIIAFGDEDNDLEMIEYAGHGIAMGNAMHRLKDIAKDVTKTNEEDGVGLYLQKILKL